MTSASPLQHSGQLGHHPLGDYDNVLAIGKSFTGAFSANNYPDSRNFYPGVKFQRYVDGTSTNSSPTRPKR